MPAKKSNSSFCHQLRYFQLAVLMFGAITASRPDFASAYVPQEQTAITPIPADTSDLDWKDRQRLVSLELARRAGNANVDGFVKLLHPTAQKLVDRNQLKTQLERIRRRFGSLKPNDWKQIETQGEQKGMRTVYAYDFEKGNAAVWVRYADFRPTGIYVGSRGEMGKPEIGIDTFSCIKPPEGMLEHGAKFWTLMSSGEGAQAFDHAIPDTSDLPGSEDFKNVMVKFAELLDKEGDFIAFDDTDVRINGLAEESSDLHLTIYQLGILDKSRIKTLKLEYELDDDGGFHMVQFQANPNQNAVYPVTDLAKVEKFFVAIGEGDRRGLLRLMHPSDIEAINLHEPTLEAFLKTVSNRLGKFKRIPVHEFMGKTEWVGEGMHAMRFMGPVEFEKMTINISGHFGMGTLESFDFEFNQDEVDGWQKAIAELGDYERAGKTFLTSLANDNVATAVDRLAKDFFDSREEGIKSLEDGMKVLLETSGEFKNVRFKSKEFIDGKNVWRFHYDVEFKNETLIGYVDYFFDAFGGSIDSFNCRRDKGDEEDK